MQLQEYFIVKDISVETLAIHAWACMSVEIN